MIIGGDRKRLESALVKRARSLGVKMGVPALRVRNGKPAHQFGEFPVFFGPQHQMPMIGQDTIGQKTNGQSFEGFREDTNEGLEINGFGAERGPTDGAVQNVIDAATSAMT
jgi:hypothetical protein